MASLWIFAAIGTATCFAISSLISYDAAKALGALVFSFVRMLAVALGFGILVAFTGYDTNIGMGDVVLLALSGLFGVLLADTFRYASLVRIGPSLQSLLGTTTAPFALLLGFVVLGQIVNGISLLGTGIVFCGIIIAVMSRNSSTLSHFSGQTAGVWYGVSFGLASALMQAGSVLVAAPVMLNGADPVTATFIRSTAGSLSLLIPVVLSGRRRSQIKSMTMPILRQVLLCAAIGTGMGMTLQLYALSRGPVGIVSTLSSTTPLIILPLIWALGKSRPPVFAWIGAACAVVGVALIVNMR